MPNLPPHLVLIGLIFLLAGTVKGVSGMGLPTVSIGLLGLFMAPAQAAALIVFPAAITNIWQFATGPRHLALLRRFGPMMLATALATWSATGMITGDDAGEAATALGLALIVYAAIGLTKYRLRVAPRSEGWMAPVIGAVTGIVTGATGVFGIPSMLFLQAVGLEAEELVQAFGLSFTVSAVALAAGLASHGAFHLANGGVSLACTVPALIGMTAGRWVRRRVDPETFRRIFFAALLLLGLDLASRAVLG